MNPFESGERKVIPATLIYARSSGCILMLHRNAKGERGKKDHHKGKYNGVGGKCEIGESALETARREFEEEVGVDLPDESFTALGTLQFPNFRPGRDEDWIVFVFNATMPGAVKPGLWKTCIEGDLHWIEEGKLLDLPLWAGDRLFLPLVLSRTPFIGTFWYEGEEVRRHWLQRLSP